MSQVKVEFTAFVFTVLCAFVPKSYNCIVKDGNSYFTLETVLLTPHA